MEYGDIENARKDVKTLHDIMNRQGVNLLIDVIAEHAGNAALAFKLNEKDRETLKQRLLNELREAINERI